MRLNPKPHQLYRVPQEGHFPDQLDDQGAEQEKVEHHHNNSNYIPFQMEDMAQRLTLLE